MKNPISYFLYALGSCSVLWACWSMWQIAGVQAGEDKRAIVVRTWKETSQNFTFFRNGRVKNSLIPHIEVAILPANAPEQPTKQENLPTEVEKQPKNHQENLQNLKEKLQARRKAVEKQTSDLQKNIKDITKTVEVPADAPRFKTSVSDKAFATLFAGKSITVRVVGETVWTEDQYATVWTEQNQILLLMGTVLAGLGVLVAFISPKKTK